jgi:valyl-tRNA synthetase
MVTGYDIIFFWVARMIFQALEFTDQTPFKDVLIHGLIRDEKGRKMSKSLGNGIDPMDIKEKYGIDTLRYFLTTNSAPGQDLRFEYEKIESSWNYINKLWNISRYVMMQTEDVVFLETLKPTHLLNQMIVSSFQTLLKTVNQNYERYELSEVAHQIYIFTWDLFASWYIEMTKPLLKSHDSKLILETKQVMATLLLNLLKLLHPFMPFVTEYLYQALPYKDDESIMISAWPETEPSLINIEEVEAFKTLESLITYVRHIRNTHQVPPKKPIDIILKTHDDALFVTHQDLIEYFIHPKEFIFDANYSPSSDDITVVENGYTLIIPLGSLVDIDEQIKKQETALKKLESEIQRAQTMLKNPNFIEKAPASKIKEEESKLETYQGQFKALEIMLEGLKKRV